MANRKPVCPQARELLRSEGKGGKNNVSPITSSQDANSLRVHVACVNEHGFAGHTVIEIGITMFTVIHFEERLSVTTATKESNVQPPESRFLDFRVGGPTEVHGLREDVVSVVGVWGVGSCPPFSNRFED